MCHFFPSKLFKIKGVYYTQVQGIDSFSVFSFDAITDDNSLEVYDSSMKSIHSHCKLIYANISTYELTTEQLSTSHNANLLWYLIYNHDSQADMAPCGSCRVVLERLLYDWLLAHAGKRISFFKLLSEFCRNNAGNVFPPLIWSASLLKVSRLFTWNTH